MSLGRAANSTTLLPDTGWGRGRRRARGSGEYPHGGGGGDGGGDGGASPSSSQRGCAAREGARGCISRRLCQSLGR